MNNPSQQHRIRSIETDIPTRPIDDASVNGSSATQSDELSAANRRRIWNNLRDDQRAAVVEYTSLLLRGPVRTERVQMHIFIHENVNLLEYALLLLWGPDSLGRCRMLSFVFQNFLGHGVFPDVVEYTSLLLRGPDAIERIQLLNYIYYIYRNVDVLQYPLLLLRGPDTPQRIQMLKFVCENAIRQRTMVAENTAAAVATDDEPGNPIDRLANVEGRPEIENRNCHDDNGAIKQEPTGEVLVESSFDVAADAPGNANNGVANAEIEAEDGNEDPLIK